MAVPALRSTEPVPPSKVLGPPSGPIVPQPPRHRDRVLPLLVVLSLVAHVAIVAPSLFQADQSKPAAQEIPVELVQLPPEPPKAKPPPPKKAPTPPGSSKPQPAKADPPKPASSKPEPPKPEPRKPEPRKSEPPKPEPPKPPVPKPPSQKPEQSKPQSQVPSNDVDPSGSDRFKSLIGAMPAFALPTASDQGTESVSYTQLVLSQVAKAKKEGRFRGMPGAASVAFRIDDHGGLASVEIVRPSGIPDLDAEAIAMIRRGAPYPPPPAGGRRDYTITLRFQPLI